MRETWYVLENGTYGDPADVAPDKAGALRHKDGIAVAMRGDVPSSRSVDAGEERAKAAAKTAPKPKEVKPEEPKGGYRTREAKAE